MKSHYLSKSGPITIGKLKQELRDVPDEYTLTPHEWGWISSEPPIEPDRTSMKLSELEVPAGTKVWIGEEGDTQLFEFDERTKILIEAPHILPPTTVPTVAEYEKKLRESDC